MKENKKNRSNSPSNARKIAFCAIMTALGAVVLLLGSLIEMIDITMAAMASFLIIVCMVEIGNFMPFLVYLSTSALAFLLLPNKTVVLIYSLFFGFYPILKRQLERMPILLGWILKFAIFNIVLGIYYVFAREVLFPDIDNVRLYIVLLLNVIFITLDLSQTLFVTAYVRRFRKQLRINKFFK